jgi:hypothetical protein
LPSLYILPFFVSCFLSFVLFPFASFLHLLIFSYLNFFLCTVAYIFISAFLCLFLTFLCLHFIRFLLPLFVSRFYIRVFIFLSVFRSSCLSITERSGLVVRCTASDSFSHNDVSTVKLTSRQMRRSHAHVDVAHAMFRRWLC